MEILTLAISSKLRCKHLLVNLMICSFALLLFSCEEIMDLSFSGDTSKNLVVEGSITTDIKAHQVVLSYTGDFFEKPAEEMATGAKVTISDGKTTFLLHEETAGVYMTDDTVHGQPGKNYTLNIELADSRQYVANDYLNPCTPFDSISQSANTNSYTSGYGYDVLFYGKEPEPSGDYYMFLVYKDNSLYTDTITEVSFSDDEFINGMYIREYSVSRIREADLPDPQTKITLEMHSISREYYEFISALLLETVFRGSPWDGPPANVPGNVSNGARGYFSASDVKRRSKIFVPTPRIN